MYSRLAIACIALSAIMAVSAKSLTETSNVVREITVVKDIRDFTRNHPGVKLQRLSKQPGRARSNTVSYSLGGRVNGDRLVAQGADVYAYPARKDVTVQLTYPEAGTGSIVTFVELICQQESTDGNAYVVAGGIGQRFISIVVEANQTDRFSYNAQYYGTD